MEVDMRFDARRLLLSLGILLLSSGTAVSQDKAAAIEALLKRHQEVGAFNGTALVAENGKVIFKKGYGLADFEWKIPNTPDTKFRLGSITKQFTATLILQLVDEGKLTLDTTLAKALPYYRQDTGARVTIHQLLSHTSGIPSYTSQPGFFRDVSRDPYEVKDFALKFCSGELEFEPGSTFRYDNSGYFLLGAVIEQLTGKTYAEVLKERILDALGMRATGYDFSAPLIEKRARAYERSLLGVRNAPYLDMSLPYAAGSMYSTVEDLYLWDQALYAEKVLPKGSKERMWKPNLEKYGYGWGIDTRPIGPGKADRQTIGHGGGINGFSTLITRVPEDRQLVVLLNNTGGTDLDAMFTGIADILYGRTPAPVKEPVAKTLYETIEKSGMAAAAARYRELKASRSTEFDLTEGQLNNLGYELLQQKKNAEAIEVFKLNVEAFPESGNTYDSLGEAYMKAGQKELAIKSYAKSLELNPNNRNAVDQLATLTK
jgi:CubicO group peptidase (beta-lactamase class C family)